MNIAGRCPVFSPPPGYDDLLADAARTANRSEPERLDVEGVGLVWARFPKPASAAALAQVTRRRGLDDRGRADWLHRFVAEHLEPGGLDDLLLAMMEERLDGDAVEKVARAVCKWGTARPYLAVVTLTAITGQHYRTLRAHLLTNGHPDPMALPNLHTLLDFTEHMVVEGLQGKNATETKRLRDEFYDKLYKPDITPGSKPAELVPAGFDPDEQEAAFDAFAKATR